MWITLHLLLVWFTKLLVAAYDAEFEQDCPEELNDFVLWSAKFPFGMKDRALRTVPPSFSIRASIIPEAGVGVFAETFVPRNTWLAEYEGTILPDSMMANDTDDTYMWRIYDNGELIYYIDAYNLETSNWLRYVNCARHPGEENIYVHQCFGKIYYMTLKDLAPGQELLTYYGEDYANYLGIDTSIFEHRF